MGCFSKKIVAYTVLLLLIVINTYPALAQGRYFIPQRRHHHTIAEKVKHAVDTMSFDTTNASINPYLLPPIFPEKFLFKTTIDNPPVINEKEQEFPSLSYQSLEFSTPTVIDSMRLDAFRDYVVHHPERMRYTNSYIKEIEPLEPELETNIFREIFGVEVDADYGAVDPIQRIMPKIRYWFTDGSSLIQFSQNYISDNWYKGGTGNLNLISVQKVSANYHKDKIKFNNTLEWRLSFYTNPSKDDSLGFRIGEDLIRTYSDFGLKAIRNWSYSTNLEIKTQLFRNRNKENNELVSAPLAPLYINMGILGMKYSLDKSYKNNKYKKLKLSADISPFSAQYIYVGNKEVNPSRYGLEDGKRHRWDLGSTINASISMSFNRQISFNSRFKYFTSYDKVIMESENELNLALSRFFSTRFYVYVRFDDSTPDTRIDDLGYFQLNEVFSFGFNYKW